MPVLSADNGSHTSYIKKYSYGYVFNRFNVTKVSQKIPQIINKKFSKISSQYYQDVDGTKIKKKFVKIKKVTFQAEVRRALGCECQPPDEECPHRKKVQGTWYYYGLSR